MRSDDHPIFETQKQIDAIWDFADPASSAIRFRQAMANCNDTGARLELRTQLARAQGLQRRFEEGHQTLDEVEALLKESLEDCADSMASVRLLLERGRLFNSAG